MESEEILEEVPIKTLVRIRPFIAKQSIDYSTPILIKENHIVLSEQAGPDSKSYQFAPDILIDETQQEIEKEYKFRSKDQNNQSKHLLWQTIGNEIFQNTIKGYNCSIFCYGISGSGKRYNFNEMKSQLLGKLFQNKELIKKKNANEMKIKISIVQLYNETIIQCLTDVKFTKLKIKQLPQKGIFIQNLNQLEAKTLQQANKIINDGQKMSKIMTTFMSALSSKKYIIITLNIVQIINLQGGYIKQISSKINLVKMAGSEKIKKTGVNIQDFVKISNSLSIFGTVIDSLAKKQSANPKSYQSIHIPYRDSCLTRLFTNSLGGNCKTYFIFTIGPEITFFHETLSTLRLMQRTKKVKNNPRINEQLINYKDKTTLKQGQH